MQSILKLLHKTAQHVFSHVDSFYRLTSQK